MKKIIITILLLTTISFPKVAYATQDEHCVQVYGGGVVCGAKEHEPVDTDLGDINPAVLGAGFLLTSGALLFISRKIKKSSSYDIS